MIGRRGFIGGLIGLVAAPAIVQASSLMPVKVWKRTVREQLDGLAVGSVITIAGVEAWDRLRQKPSGFLRQFVITALHSDHPSYRDLAIYPNIAEDYRYRTVVSPPQKFAAVQYMERSGNWVSA